MPQQGQVRKDSMHNISAMSSFSVSQPQRTANDTHISGDEVVRVHESALHALQQLKEELVKANQRNDQLVQQQQQWQNEQQQLRQQVDGLRQQSAHDRDEIARLRQDCQQCQTQKDTLVTTQHRLTQEKMDLEGQLRESNRSTKELRHRTLASDNRHKELRGQLDKLNRELEEALSAKGDLTAELDALQAERVEAHTEMARLKAQLADMALERDQSQTEAKKLQEELQSTQDRLQQVHTSSEREIDRLNKALRKANDTMHKMRAEMISKARMAKNMAFSPQFQAGVTPRVHPGSSTLLDAPTASTTAVPPPNLDSAIADRLARLRDSAERAHLIRAHKRELAKIKADRDGAIQQLEVEHADVLKKLTKQHEAKRTTQVEEVTQRMQRQYESQLEDMEEEHRKKISQLQKDYGKLQEDSDESLQEALSRVARVTQDFEREASRRKALERNVEDLQQQMQMEKRETQAHFTEELERRRREWENERDSMMGSLQKDVNVAFDSRRRSFKSPRHAAAATSTPMSTTGSPRHYYPPLSSQQPHQPPRPSPLSMNSAAAFFPDKTTVDNDSPIYGGGAAYIAPSPSRQSSPSETGNGGGPPSMISQSYSDIDSVLRETEELVQSIMS
jgi:chromosome segregation ATPase